jgi:hypothetical protein
MDWVDGLGCMTVARNVKRPVRPIAGPEFLSQARDNLEIGSHV